MRWFFGWLLFFLGISGLAFGQEPSSNLLSWKRDSSMSSARWSQARQMCGATQKKKETKRSVGLLWVKYKMDHFQPVPMGTLRTAWGTYKVSLSQPRHGYGYQNPFLVSWSIWTLLGQPLLNTTVLWWMKDPLYVHACITLSKDPRKKERPVWSPRFPNNLPGFLGQNCLSSTSRVPPEIAKKIRIIDMLLHVPAFRPNGTQRYHDFPHVTLKPGVLGAPFTVTKAEQAQQMTYQQRARYWSFNVTSSPAWGRLFSNYNGSTFLPARIAKQIYSKGVRLGRPSGNPEYQQFLQLSRLLRFKQKKRTALRLATLKRIRFNTSAIFQWFEEQVMEATQFRVLYRALKQHASNIRVHYNYAPSWLNARIWRYRDVERDPKKRKAAIADMQKILRTIRRKPLPAALVKKDKKKSYRTNKRKIARNTRKALRQIRRAHRLMTRKVRRGRRKINRYFRKVQRSLKRKGKRDYLCAACSPILAFQARDIRDGATVQRDRKVFTLKGSISPDIRKHKLKIEIQPGRVIRPLQVDEKNQFSQTFALEKGYNLFSISFSGGKIQRRVRFRVEHVKKKVCYPNYKVQRQCRAGCKSRCTCRPPLALFTSSVLCRGDKACQRRERARKRREKRRKKYCARYPDRCKSKKQLACERRQPACIANCKRNCKAPCKWTYEWR